MIIGITGAKVKKHESDYRVLYKEQIIFESKIRALAVTVALDKNKCEELLTLKSNYV